MTKQHATNPRIVHERRVRAQVVDRAERQESRRRLTSQQRADRAMTEAQLQGLVTSMAELFGWRWVHFRPAQTQRGWRTPVEGPLGKGWPDLVLVRERDRRLIFAELKRELEDLRPEQRDVITTLARLQEPESICTCELVQGVDFAHAASCQYALLRHGVEVVVWRPSSLGNPLETGPIAQVLR